MGGAVLAPEGLHPGLHDRAGPVAKIKPEFDRRNVDRRALGRPGGQPWQWAPTSRETQGHAPNYPIIGDADFEVSKLYGMLPADTSGDEASARPPTPTRRPQRLRHRPGQEGQARAGLSDDDGRNFDEVVRVIDSLQLTAEHKVATPVNWQQGDDVIIAGSVSDDEAKETYPDGWQTPKPYIRIVPQPQADSYEKESRNEGTSAPDHFAQVALVVAVTGFTGLGEAARDALPRASSPTTSHRVDGIHASRRARAGYLFPWGETGSSPRPSSESGPPVHPGSALSRSSRWRAPRIPRAPRRRRPTAPAGKRVVAGGARVTGAAAADVTVVESYPASATQWTALAREGDAVGGSGC